MTLFEQAVALLSQRSRAYRNVFLRKGFDTDIVLSDLAKFCRASTSTYNDDQRLSDVLTGRREVFLRIAHHLNLTQDQLWSLYGNQKLEDKE